MRKKRNRFLAVLLGAAMATGAVAQTRHAQDPDSGIESWEAGERGVTLSLTQILPDQVRAFYLARGFGREDVEIYARACVFQTVLRNDGEAVVAVQLADWRALAARRAFRLRLEPEWQYQWAQRELPEPARIAFRWAQFPLEQRFEPGDWNQGMTAYPLPRGARFDLKFRWRVEGKTVEGLMKGVRCAADR